MASKKLVFIPVSHKENYSMSANLSFSNDRGYEIYLQNAIVALKSVKDHNADVDVALVTNFPLDEFYGNTLKKYGILHMLCPFVDYTMPPNFTWSLAFYKIATVKYVVEQLDYDYYLQLESDELCIHSLDDMWGELDHKLLTVFSPFRHGHPNRNVYSKLYGAYVGNTDGCVIEKTGAGFIAGSKASLTHFVEICDKIYGYITEHIDEQDTGLGDELYTSMYCALYPERVSRANPYVDIYWTGKFYFVSTNYQNDAVSIVHLPAEKAFGMLRLYRYLCKHGHLPTAKKIYKIMNFPKTKPPFNLYKFTQRVKGVIDKRLGKR